jgi:uncharacterized protein
MSNESTIINNESNHRFEMPVADDMAYIQYSISGDLLSLYFIFVPVASRGKGLSGIIIQYALDYAKEHHLKIKILCPFITRYLASHPEMEYEKVRS